MRRGGGLTQSGSFFVLQVFAELEARAAEPAAEGVATPPGGCGQAARGPAREQAVEGGGLLLGEL
jgi:hypothetical protein